MKGSVSPMAYSALFAKHLCDQLQQIDNGGLRKGERTISSPQSSRISVRDKELLNLCANNYLGLADDPELIQAAKEGLDRWGYGMASVRFICGTQSIHQQLEAEVSRYLGTEDTILYGSCFDANGGLFETLLGPDDAIVSDELNHASIIDGIRLCKSKRFRYRNNDMPDLRAKLIEANAAGSRFSLIATDGVFSMDGYLANLPAICDLAEEFSSLVMVDDSHAVGFVGPHGRGTPEHFNVVSRVDILTGTFGKALGGASGGYTTGRKEIIDLLRQRSRPYLFSNSLAPSLAAASLKAITKAANGDALRLQLIENTRYFRAAMTVAGFDILPGDHPIVPIMFGDAAVAQRMAAEMLDHGVYVIAFTYPVVPVGKARIRTQISAAHSPEDLETAVKAFIASRERLGGQRPILSIAQ